MLGKTRNRVPGARSFAIHFGGGVSVLNPTVSGAEFRVSGGWQGGARFLPRLVAWRLPGKDARL